jgi:hypothetical protein
MTGPFVPVGMLNLIRAVLGIHHHRFNLSVKRSSDAHPQPLPRYLFYMFMEKNYLKNGNLLVRIDSPLKVSAFWAFDRPPAGGRNSHALDFRRPAACTHSFSLHVHEPVTDKSDQHGEPETVRGPERSCASASRRPFQHR